MSTQLATRGPATPVTPAAQKQQELTPGGKWKHPKFDEITRRQYAATFDDRNVQTLVANGVVLILLWVSFNATPKMAFLRTLQCVNPFKQSIII
jgi:nucleoporin POM34